jgi:hypothetical protein
LIFLEVYFPPEGKTFRKNFGGSHHPSPVDPTIVWKQVLVKQKLTVLKSFRVLQTGKLFGSTVR